MARAKDTLEPMSMEEINRRIAETQLETANLALEEQIERNTNFKAQRAQRARQNAQRQAQLDQVRAHQRGVEKMCFHRQGGTPKNMLEGDGKSCLRRVRMLDGKTYLILCGRCGLKRLTPHSNLKARDPELYAARMAEWEELDRAARSSGLDAMEGPTFSFERNGVPFIPEFEHAY